MIPIKLEEGLSAYQCPETEGIFLSIASYFSWLGKQPERLPKLPDPDIGNEELIEDSEGAKICPESGLLMQRYRVGHGFSFFIERSPSGSLWFDKGEWKALRERQFHDELHLVFTSSWQSAVRAEKRAESERANLSNKLGKELLHKLDELHEDLKEHEYRNMAIAYLSYS